MNNPIEGRRYTRPAAGLAAVVLLVLLVSSPLLAQGSTRALVPGETITFNQRIPINIVFIGYPREDIDRGALRRMLPRNYDPIVRIPPIYYGIDGRDLGLHFRFRPSIKFASPDFEDRFFNHLASTGVPGQPTMFQTMYNDQAANIVDVTGPVLYIDAPSVEQYLMSEAKKLRINTDRSYTIFFINWYSRPDFQFHVYTKTDESDPDTGYNFGVVRDSRKIIAWGGTHGRTWFYDPSAGPEAWAGSYDVDNADLDGDEWPDYRLPPVWEYAPGGYRDPAALTNDLGLVARFVAINLLFTTSPLYDPLLTAPDVGGDKVVHVEMFEDHAGSSGLDWIDMAFAGQALSDFQPYYSWQTALEDNDPLAGPARRAFRIWAGLNTGNDCWNDYGTPFAELFCFFDGSYDDYVPAYDPEDYVATQFAFNTTSARMGAGDGLLGYADDNWLDGTQSYVFAFDTPDYRDIGYGFSTTTVHEVGHHIGLSHPHDGYDSELALDYFPGGPLYFAWSGDESHTIMSYMDLTTEFGQFDRDNMYRYEFAGYMNWANTLADDVMSHPDRDSVWQYVLDADEASRLAQRRFNQWRYDEAAASARQAFETIATAADMLGIATRQGDFVERALPDVFVPHEGDPIRFPDN